MNKVLLSTVTPVYTGAAFLAELVAELADVRDALRQEGAPVELAEAVFVDDASTDGSAEILEGLAARHSWVKPITLSRNYGQHPATVAGVLHTSGDWVATLDEDLQHRPRHLMPLLAQAVQSAGDVVFAQPQAAVHGKPFRDFSSLLYKRLVSWLAGNQEIKRFNSFRMIRGSIARAAASVSTRETYFDIALCWFTRRISTLPLPLREVREERAGKSSYRLRSLLRHGRRLLVSSQIRPLRLGGAVGMASLMLSVLGAAAALFLKLLRPESIDVQGWTSLILTLLFFGGLISLLISIALEYLSVLHLETLGRPTFFVVDRSQDRTVAEWFRSRP